MNLTKKNKTIALATFGLLVLIGTYNAVVINSDSHLTGYEVKFVKRLDEVFGVTVAGRKLATETTWHKLSPSKLMPQKVEAAIEVAKTETNTAVPTAEDLIHEAAVQEELSLSLVEVINPKKYQKGLQNNQFNGSLASNNGVIESLSVSLPNGEGMSVSFSEMTGNVFEYDLNGEIYTGMMYQVDQKAYMVTLTNGPLEGTRMRFSTETPAVEQQQTQDLLAENNKMEVGSFGEEVQPSENSFDTAAQDAAQAQGFNLDQPTTSL